MRTAMLAVWVAACASQPTCELPTPTSTEHPNVLLVVIDDVGLDQVAAYGLAPDPVPTPTLDCLCDRGVRFDQAWASPLCSPARSAMLTGQYARRDGLGRYLNVTRDTFEVPLERAMLPELLAPAGYSSALLGKWHLSTFSSPSGLDHPNLQGFDHFAGTLGNISHGTELSGGDFFTWEHLDNGEVSKRKGYATTATVDDALDAIETLPEPWVVVVSLHAGHVPLHAPPKSLVDDPVDDDDPDPDLYRAMVQAADREVGRLLHSVDPTVLARTQIWAMSDNGTPGHAIVPPFDPKRGKGTLFEGGVRVPLMVSGPGVEAGTVSDALVSLVDVVPTLVEVAGLPQPEGLDGVSLAPLLSDPTQSHHEVLYTDVTRADGRIDRAVRNAEYKVVLREFTKPEFWRLGPGLDETEVFGDDTLPALPLVDTLEALMVDLEDPRL